ncbi:alcohol dehydrogenase catalytic domain-containing protein, partial [Nocardia sp. 852002-51244_SCH5132740]|uniref:alcohol dehydrogenase catalytic domain-containing protein n=1 Tax=Nocardia sp. 852002-51244_SCH5132740 TaxID=1834099 RepID=UPI001E566269
MQLRDLHRRAADTARRTVHQHGLTGTDPRQFEQRILGGGERGDAAAPAGIGVGMEGGGEVVRVGPGVTDYAVGDSVSLTSKGMVARYHTTSTDSLTHVHPDTDAGRCSSVTAFTTAEYSLLEL